MSILSPACVPGKQLRQHAASRLDIAVTRNGYINPGVRKMWTHTDVKAGRGSLIHRETNPEVRGIGYGFRF